MEKNVLKFNLPFALYKSACSGSYVLEGVMLSDLIKIVSIIIATLCIFYKGHATDKDCTYFTSSCNQR